MYHITNTTLKETIHVFHQNLESMKENILDLKKEGFSNNLRGTHTMMLEEDEIQTVKEKYPDVEIYPAEPNSYLYYKPYIYVTEHERELPLE